MRFVDSLWGRGEKYVGRDNYDKSDYYFLPPQVSDVSAIIWSWV